jgi:peptidoglycan/xylan/chitin deacetylase (PgdA/CDA1 family)
MGVSMTFRALSLALLALLAPAIAWAGTPVATVHKANPALPGVVYHGPRDQKRIALTFDACSSRKGDRVDEKVIDELVTLDVPATLFLGGKWMEDEPRIIDRLRTIPAFELASHGYLHPHLVKLTSAEVQAELGRATLEFEQRLGRKPDLMRAPYGELDARVANIMEKDGITPVQFDLPGADSTFSKKTLVKWVTGQAKPGSIVVLHMNGHGKHTAEALPEIVDALRKQGFQFVTVGQLLGHDGAAVAEPVLTSSLATPIQLEDGPMCALGGGDADP